MAVSINQGLDSNFLLFLFQIEDKFSKEDERIQNHVRKISDQILLALLEPKPFKKFVVDFMPQMFDFRYEAVKWLVNSGLEKEDILDQFKGYLENLLEDYKTNRYAQLLEALEFALRINEEVFSSNYSDSMGESLKNSLNFNRIEYDILVMVINQNTPAEIAESIISLMNSSLKLETSIISSFLLLEREVEVSDEKLNQVVRVLSNSAQDYWAYAKELGLYRIKDTDSQYINSKIGTLLSIEAILENRMLAEQGINEYLESYD